jgi:hypothetical protein
MLTTVRSNLSRAWAIAGLAVLVVVCVVALSNLQGIYNSQKDFVVGSLLSLVGFCFGKAFSRTQEQKAIEVLRTARDGPVEEAVKEEMSARLHREGVLEELSVLARNVEAASERLGEYYDSQCRVPDFYRHAPLLMVALDDLGKTESSVISLQQKLCSSGRKKSYRISPEDRLALVSIQRDLREALGRRDQAYEWFVPRLNRQTETSKTQDAEEMWDMFAVMSSDIRKGQRTLEALMSQQVLYPIEDYIRSVSGYLNAALRRAAEFADLIKIKNVPKPKILEVMIDDLEKAVKALDGFEPHMATPSRMWVGRTDV